MEINYSKFKTLPCCKHCNIKLVDDSIWNKYRLRKKFVGDRFALKDYELYGKIYNRKICETCLSKFHNIEMPKKLNILSYNFEFILEIPREDLEKYCFEKRRVTKENMISKYGETEGLVKWKEYLAKQSYTNSKEYHIEKFGKTEEEWIQYNKNRSVTKENMISRYGETKGLVKWEEYIERQRYTNSKEYYIEKFGENWEEELNKTNSAKAITLENMVLKYGEVEGKEKYFKSLGGRKNGYSIMASNFFKKLESLIIQDFPHLEENIYYLPKNKEFYIHKGNKAYFYDFVISQNINICIEFYGDVFHANPDIYKEDDKPIHFYNKDITAKKIWANDSLKNNMILERKFLLFIVWETYLKFENFIKYFYNSTLKGYINERKNNR